MEVLSAHTSLSNFESSTYTANFQVQYLLHILPLESLDYDQTIHGVLMNGLMLVGDLVVLPMGIIEADI